jgi:hypothetical protein
MVTYSFNDSGSSRVSNSKAFSSDTAEEACTAGGTVQTGVADDDVFLGFVSSTTRRVDDKTTTRQALADVVVGITLKFKCDTRGKVGTERLTSGTLDVGVNGILRETFSTVTTADLVR